MEQDRKSILQAMKCYLANRGIDFDEIINDSLKEFFYGDELSEINKKWWVEKLIGVVDDKDFIGYYESSIAEDENDDKTCWETTKSRKS
jgi:hypothetical protein